MENLRSVQLLKEQLKEKARQLKKVEVDRSKNDQRVQHVLSLTEKKITSLKDIIKDQEEQIQYNQVVANKQRKKEKETSKEKENGKAEVKVETKEVMVQDPKLLREIEELRSKNKELSGKINSEKKDRKKLEKEKTVLINEFKKLKSANDGKVQKLQKKLIRNEEKTQESLGLLEKASREKEQLVKEKDTLTQEKDTLTQEKAKIAQSTAKMAEEKSALMSKVKKLKENPREIENLRQKIDSLEKQIRESEKRSMGLANEKDELIKSYEKMLFVEGADDGTEKRLPSEIIGELKEDLKKMVKERDKLEKDLIAERKMMEDKLAQERMKMESEIAEKMKFLKQEKGRVAEFGEMVSEDDVPSNWLITYADMVTLLLTFFVLYYSISSVNMQKFKEAILGEESASIGVLEMLDSIEIKEQIQSLTQTKTKDILTEMKEVAEDQHDLDIATDKSKIVVRVPGNSLFESGEAFLVKNARGVLDEIIKVIGQYPEYKVHIQGHTDDIPISTERFPSNWELSSARATAVLRYFIDKGMDPLKVTATGYADMFPLFTNDTELGRSKNRRVEFVLEKEK